MMRDHNEKLNKLQDLKSKVEDAEQIFRKTKMLGN